MTHDTMHPATILLQRAGFFLEEASDFVTEPDQRQRLVRIQDLIEDEIAMISLARL